jgi:hypothetical protein
VAVGDKIPIAVATYTRVYGPDQPAVRQEVSLPTDQSGAKCYQKVVAVLAEIYRVGLVGEPPCDLFHVGKKQLANNALALPPGDDSTLPVGAQR